MTQHARPPANPLSPWERVGVRASRYIPTPGSPRFACRLALALSLLAAACAPRAAEPPAPSTAPGPVLAPARETVAVNVAYPALSVSWLPLKIADARGFFKDEALDVTFTRAAATVSMTGLISKDLDFVTDVGSAIRLAVAQDAPLRTIFVTAQKPVHTLNVRPEIRSLADLRGKLVGIPPGGAAGEIMTRRVLLGVGLQPDRDVTLIALGDDAARRAALDQNIIQATVFPPPVNVKAEVEGYPVLAKTGDYIDVMLFGLAAHRDTIAERPDVVKRMLRAAVRGLRYIHEQRDGTVQVIQDWVELDAAGANRVYELSIGAYPASGMLTDRMLEVQLADAREEGGLPDDRAADPNLIRDMAPLRDVLKELRIPE
jgi:NitT/TauT family transport system substrate-binding protein